MEYKVQPFSGVWENGIFNLPIKIADDYLKLASEYQIKALIYIFRHSGKADTAEIAKALGQTAGDIDNLLEFWVEEGVIAAGADESKNEVKPVSKGADNKKESEKVIVKETLPPPSLTPKDIIVILREDKNLQYLVNEAQKVLGRTISPAEQSIIINMVNYYGLKPEIVLMILEYYKSEKQKGLSISFAYINAMAKNWSDEGINSISSAEEKLREIERSSRLWNEITAITGIRHKRPTQKQRETVLRWFADFDVTMITLASDMMKENIPEPNLKYIDTILKKWKKAGIKTPADVQKEREEFAKSKTAEKKKQSSDKLRSKPSYDLEKIKRDAMNNTDIF